LSALSGSSRLLAMHKKSVLEQGFFYEFAFDDKALKTFDEFQSVEMFEVRTLSNSNFVTSLQITYVSRASCIKLAVYMRLAICISALKQYLTEMFLFSDCTAGIAFQVVFRATWFRDCWQLNTAGKSTNSRQGLVNRHLLRETTVCLTHCYDTARPFHECFG